jgi:hypothetical protein
MLEIISLLNHKTRIKKFIVNSPIGTSDSKEHNVCNAKTKTMKRTEFIKIENIASFSSNIAAQPKTQIKKI